ncbi:MAG: hypothetical protein JSV04_01545 [Candidatus Heimdallarchaeota archaeon]|nr:MAG: hypothetical protein JSV04_01545 [Candidatus Heimdallarchaeota archaeon]
MYSDLYNRLNQYYSRLDPHHETWVLWIKGNKTPKEIFEVAIGTILVQNTNWRNVDKVLANLKSQNVFSFPQVLEIKQEKLEQLVQPAGFYKQKAVYLKSLSALFLKYPTRDTLPSRKELLECRGVGKETADSILVYCFQHPIPIVGTYTRRFLARFFAEKNYLKMKYEIIQQELNDNLERDFEVFGRFHALVVCHGQNFCQKNTPRCLHCFLLNNCQYGQLHESNSEIAKIQTLISRKTKKKPSK